MCSKSVTCPDKRNTSGDGEGRGKRKKGGTEVWRGYTHISFTENDVYYAAKNDEGVKRVPGITKIALNRAGRVQMFEITNEM